MDKSLGKIKTVHVVQLKPRNCELSVYLHMQYAMLAQLEFVHNKCLSKPKKLVPHAIVTKDIIRTKI